MRSPLGAPWRQPVGAPWRLLARFFVLAAVLQPCATTRRECGLVVVEAGAPRTGSTQQERLINVALKELGLSDKVSDCGYYDWANHAKLDAAEAKAAAAELEARPCPLRGSQLRPQPTRAGEIGCWVRTALQRLSNALRVALPAPVAMPWFPALATAARRHAAAQPSGFPALVS